jgi:hypothetical protein
MHGLVSPQAVGVSIYTLEGTLIQSFSSRTEAANYLGVSQSAIVKAIQRGSIVKKAYRVISSK